MYVVFWAPIHGPSKDSLLLNSSPEATFDFGPALNPTLNYQNHLFCRLPILSIFYMLRTFQNHGYGSQWYDDVSEKELKLRHHKQEDLLLAQYAYYRHQRYLIWGSRGTLPKYKVSTQNHNCESSCRNPKHPILAYFVP